MLNDREQKINDAWNAAQDKQKAMDATYFADKQTREKAQDDALSVKYARQKASDAAYFARKAAKGQ